MTGAGPLIGRLPAQRLARRELSQLAKLPWWERVLEAAFRGLADSGAGQAVLIVPAVLVLVLIVVVVVRTMPRAGPRIRGGGVLGGKQQTAAEYRARAARLAQAGDFSEAIVEGVRAVAAELTERGVLVPKAGRTANEIAAEAGAELPALAGGLGSAARLFDDVRYGGRAGTAAGYELVSQVDAQVRTARTATALTAARAGGTAPGQPAVPR
jgi:hypothetical protein